jgi:hypothetical protein
MKTTKPPKSNVGDKVRVRRARAGGCLDIPQAYRRALKRFVKARRLFADPNSDVVVSPRKLWRSHQLIMKLEADWANARRR